MKLITGTETFTCILVTIPLLVSCSGSHRTSSALNAVPSKPCVCSAGIGSSQGDIPVLTLTIDDKPRLAVCGYPESVVEPASTIISEFDVFDCSSNLSVARYGANDSREVSLNANSIDISHLISLPAGPHWAQRDVLVSHHKISVTGSSVQISTRQTLIEPPALEPEDIESFKRTLFELKSRPRLSLKEWEITLSQLLVCSLMTDEQCLAFLRNPETLLGLKLDGTASQMHQDAVQLFDQLTRKTT